MAANNRNKLDEYHLKILRELLTYPANKYCFDCHQRGPTYVNITIGSFVCTRCSGMLRGLTPPHRVKSITMATFTPEEIDIMKSRGNEYCKNLWLGLYDAEIPIKDEQQIKDFMIAKYEKKRYYADPVIGTHCVINFANGSRTPSSISSTSSSSHNSPSSQNLSDSSTKAQNAVRSQFSSNTNSVTSSNNSSQLFPANFESPMSSSASSADPFGSSGLDSSSCSESSFANFDNNPAFGSNNRSVTGIATDNNVSFGKTNADSNVPGEDKYAALKDLDFQMKNQMLEKQQQEMKQKMNSAGEWGAGTNGINWSTVFSNHPGVTSEPSTPFNPFAGEINAWNAPTNGTNGTVNPFGSNIKDIWNGNVSWQNSKNQIQSAVTTPNGWNKDVANPFKFHPMGVWTQTNGQHQSSNPFL